MLRGAGNGLCLSTGTPYHQETWLDVADYGEHREHFSKAVLAC